MLKLFSTSGIRSTVDKLTPVFVTNVGQAICQIFGKGNESKFIIARDTRSSGLMLEHSICAGIIAGGCNVERKGIIPTPALAYHTYKSNARAGVMLTASHNPPEYNGIKVFDKSSVGLSPEEEAKIEKAILKNNFLMSSWNKIGNDIELLGSDLYNKMLLDVGANINFGKLGMLINDPGGGASCEIIETIYKTLDVKFLTINGLFDPYFSARPSEPIEENLSQLISIVTKYNLKDNRSIGFAYDGDADRCVVVDEKGRFVPLDVMISLYAQYVIEQNKGKGLVITHIDASMLIDKLVNDAGGEVKRTSVGDVAIGNMINKEKAIFGGEPCGAWIHPKYHLCPDGLLTGLKILEWITERGPLFKMVDDVKDFPVNRTKVYCQNEIKQSVMHDLDKIISAKDDYKEILKIDGLRINYKDSSWVLIRPSGTEPYIRVTSQAYTNNESKIRMEYFRNLVSEQIKKKINS